MSNILWTPASCGGEIVRLSSAIHTGRQITSPVSAHFRQACVLLVLVTVNDLLAKTRAFGSVGDVSSNFHVATDTGRIHDSSGRERIFHGLNVVVKAAPWHPGIDAFDPQSSFTDADIALLKEWGMNVVRLGIMWPGVEPSRGYVNVTYLQIMRKIVGKLYSAGIYTLLEFHQDLYSSQFCGEGLPPWILDDRTIGDGGMRRRKSLEEESQDSSALVSEVPTRDQDDSKRSYHIRASEKRDKGTPRNASGFPQVASRFGRGRGMVQKRSPERPFEKLRYPASFPEPLGKRWPWPSEEETDRWEPMIERCSEHTWWSYYLSFAVSRAFQDLYDNKWGWGDLLARYWSTVAGAFKNEPGVIGYEIMNEPWPGDVFYNRLLFLPGMADSVNLARFYEKQQAAVRSVDRERILFFETITFDNFRCGWSTVPGGAQWQNKTVLSYHYYKPPNFSAKQALAERSRESRRLGCGSMLTEFFVSPEQGPQDTKDFLNVRRAMATVEEGDNRVMRAYSEPPVCNRGGETSPTLHCGHTARSFGENPKLNTKPIASPGGSKGMPSEGNVSEGHERTASLANGRIDQTALIGNNRRVSHPHLPMTDGSGKKVADSLSAHKMRSDPEDDFEERDQINQQEETDSVTAVLSAADDHVQSWIGWEYKAFVPKTGSVVKQSLFLASGEVNRIVAKRLARTYPQSVCGEVNSFSFDPASSLFLLSYVAGRECKAVTEEQKGTATDIFVQRRFYYPRGLIVKLSRPCASYTETDTIIVVSHAFDCVGLVIDVSVSKALWTYHSEQT